MSKAAAKIPAVFLDWAGTAVDHGSIAPVNALEVIFSQFGVTVPRPLVRNIWACLRKITSANYSKSRT